MLSNLSTHLRNRRVILASQSPRRLELLRDCGLSFEVIPSTFEENLPKEQFATPDLYVIENAKQKALEVLHRVSSDKKSESELPVVIIGCDTVVVQDGVILEKPKDEQDAFNMLTELSGRPHQVFSGVALLTAKRGINDPYLFFETTHLVFGPLEPEDIRSRARCFVKEIRGCSNNVIGFPVQRFCREINALASRGEL
uniref:Septum formation protein Maf n=1 Tax=Hyaloperonospora arabidopsidis (strain Emoy2) TaxID=559515 RepID=M4B541_HYAAE